MKKTISEANAKRFGWTKKYEVILSHVEYDFAGDVLMSSLSIIGEFDSNVDALECLNSKKKSVGLVDEDWGATEEWVSIETHWFNKKGERKGWIRGIV